MATTKRLVESALRSIGVLASGEEAQPAELQDALLYAKQMLDSWTNETLLVPALVHEQFTLTEQNSFTIGPGGDFDTVRPTVIEQLNIKTPEGYNAAVEIVGLNTWSDIPIKNNVQSYPRYAYYTSDNPLGILRFSAVIAAGNELLMVSSKPIQDLPALTAEVEFPPGYERAIRLGLALELAPEYGKQVDRVIAAQYAQARKVLKRTNSTTRLRELQMDPGLTGSRGYDIYSGPG